MKSGASKIPVIQQSERRYRYQSGELHLRKPPFLRTPPPLLGTRFQQGGGFLDVIPLITEVREIALCAPYLVNILLYRSAFNGIQTQLEPNSAFAVLASGERLQRRR